MAEPPDTVCINSAPWSLNHLSISFNLKSGGAWRVNIIMRPMLFSFGVAARASLWHLRIMRSFRWRICMMCSQEAVLSFASSLDSALSR